jgi:SEC-C motif-containing protein
MRSRYSAYVLQLHDYLLDTWHPTTRPADLGDPDQARTKWIGLQVRRAQKLPVDAGGRECALVEFVARYRVGSRGYRLEERSRFVREEGRWYYVAGEVSTDG